MTRRRMTFRGSPAQAAESRRFWLGVAGNVACALAFTGGLLFCLNLVADHLAS